MIMKMQTVENQLHVSLSGSIYAHEAREVLETLTPVIDNRESYLSRDLLQVDLGQVDYIDSAGLGMLLSLQKQAMLKGGYIRLIGFQGLVREVFEVTRFEKEFKLH